MAKDDDDKVVDFPSNEGEAEEDLPVVEDSRQNHDYRRKRRKHAALLLRENKTSQKWQAQCRDRRSRNELLVKDVEELELLWDDYVVSLSERPFIHERPTKDGGTFRTQSDLPVSQAGLCAFAGFSVRTWSSWKTPTAAQYRGDEFADAMESIETRIYAMNLEKGLTGELTPNLMGRFLGIADKKDVAVTHQQSGDQERLAKMSIDKANDLLEPPRDIVEGKAEPAKEMAK